MLLVCEKTPYSAWLDPFTDREEEVRFALFHPKRSMLLTSSLEDDILFELYAIITSSMALPGRLDRYVQTC